MTSSSESCRWDDARPLISVSPGGPPQTLSIGSCPESEADAVKSWVCTGVRYLDKAKEVVFAQKTPVTFQSCQEKEIRVLLTSPRSLQPFRSLSTEGTSKSSERFQLQRAGHQISSMGEQGLLVSGGTEEWNSGSYIENKKLSSSLMFFDRGTWSWKTLGVSLENPRAFHLSYWLPATKQWVVCGGLRKFAETKVIERFDWQSDSTWKPNFPEVKSTRHWSLFGATYTPFQDRSGSYLIAVGGLWFAYRSDSLEKDWVPNQEVWKIPLKDLVPCQSATRKGSEVIAPEEWISLGKFQNVPFGHAAVVDGDRVLISGGMNVSGLSGNSVTLKDLLNLKNPGVFSWLEWMVWKTGNRIFSMDGAPGTLAFIE